MPQARAPERTIDSAADSCRRRCARRRPPRRDPNRVAPQIPGHPGPASWPGRLRREAPDRRAVGGTDVAILWPVFALAALVIKLESHGPVLIRQKRVGLDGREFDFFKFRTMHHHKTKHDLPDRLPPATCEAAAEPEGAAPKNATPIGWALRKTTVDELPQLLNVVTGDMSIVGPRPDIPEIVEALAGAVPPAAPGEAGDDGAGAGERPLRHHALREGAVRPAVRAGPPDHAGPAASSGRR